MERERSARVLLKRLCFGVSRISAELGSLRGAL